MEIFRRLEAVPGTFGPVVATIGNFDGVHCGHRWVIRRVRERAAEMGVRAGSGARVRSAVVTFDPHPGRVLRPDERRLLLTPLERKLELLRETGVDAVVVLPFSDELARTTARDFACDVLRDRLHVTELHEGENFRFGHGAEADLKRLEEFGVEMGFHVVGYAPQMARGGVISSSRIRELVAGGEVGVARTLLGRVFGVDSRPASGRGFGTKYLVPTINLARYEELLPGNGVYVTRLRVGRQAGYPDGRWFDGVTNVGVRPTFGEDSFAVETYLLGYDPATSPLVLEAETPLRLLFLKRLRGEKRWESPEALKAQIGVDVGRARRFLSLAGVLAEGGRRRI